MSLWSTLKGMDKRFAWSFIGTVLTVGSIGYTIYIEYFRINTPAVVVELLSETNVLDVKEDINELKVLYDNVDIKSLNKTLTAMVFKIRNEGGASVEKGAYDNNYPFSISMDNAKILKLNQVSASSGYLESEATPSIVSDGKVVFPNVILDPQDNYTIKVLALHDLTSTISFNVSGKIAGVRNIVFRARVDEQDTLSFWDLVLLGDYKTQLVRMIVYSIVLVVTLLFIYLVIVVPLEKLSSRSKEKIIAQYRDYHGIKEFTKNQQKILNVYINQRFSSIKLNQLDEILLHKKDWADVKADDLDFPKGVIPMHELFLPLKFLKHIGVISFDRNGKLIVDKPMEDFLRSFVKFVNLKMY